MPKTEDAIVALGNYCEALLRDENFNTLCDDFEQQTVSAMLSTDPSDAARREQLYESIQGKREFIGLMLEYVNARDSIINRDQNTDDL